jgi:hypothetical protein
LRLRETFSLRVLRGDTKNLFLLTYSFVSIIDT